MITPFTKEPFEKIFYSNDKSNANKVIVISFLFLASLFVVLFLGKLNGPKDYIILITAFLALASILIFGIYLRFFREEKIAVGLNKEGVFIKGVGWIYWDEVRDISVRTIKSGYLNKKGIFFSLHTTEAFYMRMSTIKRFLFLMSHKMVLQLDDTVIPVVFSHFIKINLNELFLIMKDYHLKKVAT